MPYGPILLGAVLIEYSLLTLSDRLNVRSLRPELPPAFANVYDPARYARSQAYTRAQTRLGWVSRTLDLTILLTFWLSGGFDWLDRLVRGAALKPIPTGILYVGSLVIATALLSLPFRWYSAFVIEERFGFNTTTRTTFVLDEIKTMALTLALGGPLLAIVLWLFARTGESAWLWCFGVTSAFLTVVQYVAPMWIMPLFNEFRPVQNGDLKEAVLTYTDRAGFPIDGLFVIDGSKRSTKANAFLAGFGRRKRVALFDTLIQQHTTEEIVAIVAHEVGHFKKRHILKGLVVAIAQVGALFFLLGWFLDDPRLFDAFRVSRPSPYTGLVLFAIAYAPIGLVVSTVVQAWERRQELEADAFARRTTGQGEVLAHALEKLSADSLSNLTPHPFYVMMHHSHPPLSDRVAALRA